MMKFKDYLDKINKDFNNYQIHKIDALNQSIY